jgi:hypothetical protein
VVAGVGYACLYATGPGGFGRACCPIAGRSGPVDRRPKSVGDSLLLDSTLLPTFRCRPDAATGEAWGVTAMESRDHRKLGRPRMPSRSEEQMKVSSEPVALQVIAILIDQPAGLAGEREEPRLRTYDSFELTVISIEGDTNVTKSARCARWAIYRHV